MNNQEIPLPNGLEQRLSALIDRLEAEEKRRGTRAALTIALAIAAAFMAIVFLLIVPQVRERRELACYEGSYTVVNGQRINDIVKIRSDISEALTMAKIAEANVPAADLALEAEYTMLQATDDPEMRAAVLRILH